MEVPRLLTGFWLSSPASLTCASQQLESSRSAPSCLGRWGSQTQKPSPILIEARTEAERRRAVRLSGGALARAAEALREALLTALALCEAHIDFSDESDVPDGAPTVDAALVMAVAEIDALLSGAVDADKLSEGFHVALVGAPNAGKSSLLNAIAGRSVAIVSDEAGTTRDVVTLTVDLGGYRTVISDTAGLREGATGVEAVGIDRTREAANRADLIVEVVSPDTPRAFTGSADLVVGHKVDAGVVAADLSTSIHDPESIDRLTDCLAAVAANALSAAESAVVTRARQREALSDAADAIRTGLEARHLELKAEALRSAARAIGRLTGEVDVEEVLDRVFSRFCIGK